MGIQMEKEDDDQIDGGEYGIIAPEPSCPSCGAKKWRYIMIPEQTELAERLNTIANRILMASFLVLVATILLFVFPLMQNYGFIGLGALVILFPLSFVIREFGLDVRTRLDLCESCGYTKVRD
jgi:hypothetical protein